MVQGLHESRHRSEKAFHALPCNEPDIHQELPEPKLAPQGWVSNKLPTDRYIDGIDQKSWLLTDEDYGHESNREAFFY